MTPKTLMLPLVAALLAPTLGGCFRSVNIGTPGLPGALPRQCQRLLTKVPDPGAKEGQDLADIAAGYRGAWLKGNHRIEAGRACEDKQADAVAEGAK